MKSDKSDVTISLNIIVWFNCLQYGDRYDEDMISTASDSIYHQFRSELLTGFIVPACYFIVPTEPFIIPAGF